MTAHADLTARETTLQEVDGHVVDLITATEAVQAAVEGQSGGGGGSVTVSGAVDVSDRSARLLGHVTLDNATLQVDVADEPARQLGHVNVDNFPAGLTDTQLRAAVVPVTDIAVAAAIADVEAAADAVRAAVAAQGTNALATEAKAETIRSALVALGSTPLATEAKAEAIRALLATELVLIDTDVLAVRDRLPAALTAGRLAVEAQAQAAASATAALGGVGQAATLAVPSGMGNVVIALPGTFVATVAFEVSFDGGALFFPLTLGIGSSTGSTATNTTSNNSWWEGGVPAGATHIRGRCSAFTSGPVNVVVAAAPGASEPAPIVSGAVAVNAGNNRLGFTAASGIWQDDTSTNLGASGTFTGTTRDLTGVTFATPWNSAVTFAKEVAIGSASDVAGTLHLEVSRDNFTTVRRIRSVPAVQVGGSGLFVAEINWQPWTRYMRAVYVNGAGAQTLFLLNTITRAA